MKGLKHILSYLLLAIYTVSYGHQIIPHHHHALNDQHNHHSVGVHDHCITEKETHDHVAHEDHFDEGVIDFLACILADHEHNPAGDCELTEGPNHQKNTKTGKTVAHATMPVTKLELHFYPADEDGSHFGTVVCGAQECAVALSKRGPPTH